MGTQSKRREKAQGPNVWLIRYRDDFVIMVHGSLADADSLRAEVAAVLDPLGLRLAEEKTRAVSIDEGFDFLGFNIRRMRKRGTGERYVYTRPSRKSIQTTKDKAAEKTYRSTRNKDFKVLLVKPNKSLAGWANYFRYGVCSEAFREVDYHAWGRIMRWLRVRTPGEPDCHCERCGGVLPARNLEIAVDGKGSRSWSGDKQGIPVPGI